MALITCSVCGKTDMVPVFMGDGRNAKCSECASATGTPTHLLEDLRVLQRVVGNAPVWGDPRQEEAEAALARVRKHLKL